MIQVKELDLEMTEVLNGELGSIAGQGIFGVSLPQTRDLSQTISVQKKESGQNIYNNSFVFPTLGQSGTYTTDQASKDLGLMFGDGRGNVFEVGPGRVSYQNWGNGFDVSWNSDSVGVTGRASW
jgi:hypothetical protein